MKISHNVSPLNVTPRPTDARRGLTSQQVLKSRELYGDNVLTPPRRTPLWKQFLEKFNDPLIRILLAALFLALIVAFYENKWMGEAVDVYFEPLGIFIAIILATLVGFVVEVNANRKFNLLNQTNDDVKVKVRRDGHITQVPRRDIVVGDIVVLDTGEKVPADGTLLKSFNLRVDESSLTGEPSTWKSHNADDDPGDMAYPVNVLLRGSTVTEGTATMRVSQVGDGTEYGKVYHDAQIDNQVKTPLTQQLDRLGRTIARASYVAAALLVLGRIVAFFTNGATDNWAETAQYFIETFMLAVTLIVVSVPEGLPMSITLSLALSMRKMLKTGNLVRRMHACETMGAATVICTDKTGTLTQNKMQVYGAHFYNLDDSHTLSNSEQGALVQESIACNSTAFLDDSDPDKVTALGNPTEGALLLWLHDAGIDYLKLRENSETLAVLPFSTERKYMATAIRSSLTGKRLLLIKGAPEVVMRMCDKVEHGATFQQFTDELTGYQNQAMRTLAFAWRELSDDEDPNKAIKGLKNLTLLGVTAISDPVREDVPAAIADCLSAGIKVKIVTGDTAATAREIARQVGLWTDADNDNETAIVTGPDFAALSDDEAAQRAAAIKIMARARPDDKARLVKLLQQQGEVVAVTGDGTNDAPALNAAQVGLSMGDGTAVAKEASDITILDNSFASINKAVLWGRSLYRNIQRFILFQLTVNVCACLVVAVCSFFSVQPALTVTQMLWVNLIMDTLAALALASLPPNSIVMRSAPRGTNANILTRDMKRFIGVVGGAFAVLLIIIYICIIQDADGSNIHGLHSNISYQEMAKYFSVFVFLQFWNLFNARAYGSGHTAFHNLRGSKVFVTVAAVIFVGQILIVKCAGTMFDCKDLPKLTWVAIIGLTSLVMWAGVIYHLLSGAKNKAR